MIAKGKKKGNGQGKDIKGVLFSSPANEFRALDIMVHLRHNRNCMGCLGHISSIIIDLEPAQYHFKKAQDEFF